MKPQVCPRGERVCGMHDAEVSVVQIATGLNPSALTQGGVKTP
jgi:hypothetical protein